MGMVTIGLSEVGSRREMKGYVPRAVVAVTVVITVVVVAGTLNMRTRGGSIAR